MPAENKVFYRGAAATSNLDLYVVPSGKTSVITSIIVANTSGSSQTFNLSIDSGIAGEFALQSGTSIAANTTVYIDCKHVLSNNDIDTLKGFASATSVNFSICGMEIT